VPFYGYQSTFEFFESISGSVGQVAVLLFCLAALVLLSIGLLAYILRNPIE
jgi:hypothetical protein